MNRQVFALSFTSPLSLSELRNKWNEIGPWTWTERESDTLGDYISTRVLDLPQRGMVKVFHEGDRYVINVLLQSDEDNATTKFHSIRRTIFDSTLPAIQADAIEETEAHD